jgi:4-hydroxy-tetrahydrodipicolinate synthase
MFANLKSRTISAAVRQHSDIAFRGSFTALVTPFRNGAVDESAFADLVEWQIGEGTHGLVPTGTTGESPTLSHPEHRRVIELCVKVAAGRVPVIAGTGSNNTLEAIELSRFAEQAGASALLVVTPYYNKPSQAGLYQHFKAINDAVGIPIFLYNIPPRSVVDISVETMAEIAKLKNVVGVKDATARIERVSLQREAIGKDFIQFSGEDATALGFMAHGGHGCISVSSNVAPRLLSEFQKACLAGDYAAALALQDRLMPLHRALFLDPNPAGAKYALSLLGRMTDELRLPLVGATDSTKAEIRTAMRRAGLIN